MTTTDDLTGRIREESLLGYFHYKGKLLRSRILKNEDNVPAEFQPITEYLRARFPNAQAFPPVDRILLRLFKAELPVAKVKTKGGFSTLPTTKISVVDNYAARPRDIEGVLTKSEHDLLLGIAKKGGR